jgi:hypoxanthine phosphoribosyltransferase
MSHHKPPAQSLYLATAVAHHSPETSLEAQTLSSSSARAFSEFSDPKLEPLITAEQIQTRITELGAEIARDYEGRNPLMIGVLKGAFIFFSDLMRAIDIRLGVEFMAISSYGELTRSSGEVKIVKDLDVPIEGRDIIVVEDIVDTGLTLSYLFSVLHTRGAKSVKLAALLDKWERRQREVPIDYLGFKIPDAFVVGYGLDFAERYRNLPYIAIVRESDA